MRKLIRGIGAPMLALVLTTVCAAQQSDPVTLTVGSPAPPLEIKKWIKGTPVTTLGHGTVNVVEFWATWCGPCKMSIPHLTELAHKYQGKATFTGVSVWEDPQAKDETYLSRVDSFVKDMGAKMDYNVGADGLQATMAKTWMSAAGQNGIPTAFVVDQKGQVAWIGHPMAGLDEVVQKVIDGTYDVKAESEKAAKEKAEQEQIAKDAEPLGKSVQAGDLKTARIELDKLIAKHPALGDQLSSRWFTFLLAKDETAAYAYGKELAHGRLKDNGDLLNSMAWSIVDDNSKLKHPDYSAAVLIARQAAEANHMQDPMSLDTYAYALFKKGDKDAGIAVEEKAIALLSKPGSSIPEETAKEIKDRLLV